MTRYARNGYARSLRSLASASLRSALRHFKHYNPILKPVSAFKCGMCGCYKFRHYISYQRTSVRLIAVCEGRKGMMGYCGVCGL